MKAISQAKALTFNASAMVEEMRLAFSSIAFLYAKGGNTRLFSPAFSFKGVAGFNKAFDTLATLANLPDALPETMDGYKPSDEEKKGRIALQEALGATFTPSEKKGKPPVMELDEDQAMDKAMELFFPASRAKGESKVMPLTKRARLFNMLDQFDSALLNPEQAALLTAFKDSLNACKGEREKPAVTPADEVQGQTELG